MNTYLDGILKRKREDLIARKGAVPLAELKTRATDLPPPLDFTAALGKPGMRVIAEIKKASPSRGCASGLPGQFSRQHQSRDRR